MNKQIRVIGQGIKRIRDTSETIPRIDPDEFARALGAEASGVSLEEILAPITLQAVREELFKRLQSSGGRPALSDTTRRPKIPLSDADWAKLEQVASTFSSPGSAPSAGQVASILLSMSLNLIAAQKK